MESFVRTPQEFISFCTALLADLKLGFPMGIDNDFADATVVSSKLVKAGRLLTIHAICIFLQDRSLNADDLLSLEKLRLGGSFDIVIVMTNATVAASAAGLVHQLERDLAAPVVIWSNQLIEWLSQRNQPGIASDKLAEVVHAMLLDRLKAFESSMDSIISDPRLDFPYEPPQFAQPGIFVNRHIELTELAAFDRHQASIITGPAGIGKSMLAREVVGVATREGFWPVISADHHDVSAITQLAIQVAKALAERASSPKLLQELKQYGTRSTTATLAILLRGLRKRKFFVLIEDIHTLEAPDSVFDFIDLFTSSRLESKLLLTSRVAINRPKLSQSLFQVDLKGFDKKTTEQYFDLHSLRCPPRILQKLVHSHGGWPILVATIGAQLRGSRPERRINQALALKSDVMSNLTDTIVSGLSPEAGWLFALIVASQIPVRVEHLCSAGGLTEASFCTAWKELQSQGLVGGKEPANSVHGIIRENVSGFLRQWLEANKVLGLLLSEAATPDAIAASVSHFLEANEPEAAASQLISRAELLIRGGNGPMCLKLIAKIDPTEVPEEAYLWLTLVAARALELESRVDEAHGLLAGTFMHRSCFRPSVELQGRYLYVRARLEYFLGNYRVAENLLAELAGIIGISGDTTPHSLRLRGAMLTLAGRIQFVNRSLTAAEVLYRQSFVLHKAAADALGMNKTLHRIGMVLQKRGKLKDAEAIFQQVERESRRLNDMKRLSYALHRLGEICAVRGEFSLARRFFYKSLRIKRKIRHQRGLIYTYVSLARLELTVGNLEKSMNLAHKALKLSTQLEVPKEEGLLFKLMADLCEARSNPDEASSWLQKAVQRFRELGLDSRAATLEAELLRLTSAPCSRRS